MLPRQHHHQETRKGGLTLVSRILFSFLLLLSSMAWGQTLTPLEFSGPIRPDYVVPGAGDKFVRAGDLDGAYVKTATFASNVLTLTTQLANNSSATVTVPITSTPAANSITAAQARASTAAFQREWKTRLAIPDDWSEIPANTPLSIGKVVEHGGAYFGALTNHNRSGTGPDGDPTNWVLLSNYRGDWVAAWYPAGSFVRRGGLPWVATTSVSVSDPAPDAATNTKWLQLGSAAPVVVSGAINANIPSSANGHTYILTGSTARTFFLPNASGTGEVPNAWEVVLGNRSSAVLSITPNGSDRINGSASLSIPAGEAVKLQKFSTSNWLVIADTGKSSGGGSFTPSKSNLYDAVKAIFVHNTAVTADDANDELDFATGVAATLNDNSIAPIKAQAGTAAQQKAWRARLASSSIGLVASALPAVANHNTGDTLVIGRGGTTTIPFREIDTPATEITTTVAGDIIMLLAAGWTRVGNLFSGGIAAVAAQLDIDTAIEVGPPFEPVVSSATGIAQRNLYVTIRHPLGAYSDANIISISVEGQTPILQSYNPNTLVATYTVGIQSSQMDNLASNNNFVEGNAVEVFIQLRDGRNGPIKFLRTVDVPVVAAPTATVDLRTQASQIATPASGDRFFFTDENQSGDPLRYTQGATLINRTLAAKTATAGASRVWTYTLDAADTEIWIGTTVTTGNGANKTGFTSTFIPRAILSSTALNLNIDHRNIEAGTSQFPDSQSAGVIASISGNTLTLNTNGWGNNTAPVVYSR